MSPDRDNRHDLAAEHDSARPPWATRRTRPDIDPTDYREEQHP